MYTPKMQAMATAQPMMTNMLARRVEGAPGQYATGGRGSAGKMTAIAGHFDICARFNPCGRPRRSARC